MEQQGRNVQDCRTNSVGGGGGRNRGILREIQLVRDKWAASVASGENIATYRHTEVERQGNTIA